MSQTTFDQLSLHAKITQKLGVGPPDYVINIKHTVRNPIFTMFSVTVIY